MSKEEEEEKENLDIPINLPKLNSHHIAYNLKASL